MSRKISLRSVISLTLATFLIFLTISCATVYYGFFIKGTIIDVHGSEVCLDIGKRDGASVGQELDVYKAIQVTRSTFNWVQTGKVKITEIIDDYFAEATVISGKVEKDDIVELVRPK